MTDTIHTCSYFCDRPDCIKAQRDELRDRIAMVVSADKQPEALTLELKRGAAARPHDVEARSLMNAAASAIAALEAENVELRKDAELWRRHLGNLDAVVTYCPTCCQGFNVLPEMTRDEVIFECGKTAGRAAALKETP